MLYLYKLINIFSYRKLFTILILTLLHVPSAAQQSGYAVSGDVGFAFIGEREPAKLFGVSAIKDFHVVDVDSGNIIIFLRPSFGVGFLYFTPEIILRILLERKFYLLAGSRYITFLHTWTYDPFYYGYASRDEWLSKTLFIFGIGIEQRNIFLEVHGSPNYRGSTIQALLLFRIGFKP